MPTNNVHLLYRNIDTSDIAHSKFLHQTTYWNKKYNRKPEPEHKQFNLANTELIDTSKDTIFTFKPFILLVSTLELLKLDTTLSTIKRKRTGSIGMPSKAIFDSKPKVKDSEAIGEGARTKSTKGINSTKLSFSKCQKPDPSKALKSTSRMSNDYLN
ncbi:hypothetical protein G9A89_005322 [Geosiphon pyriformis]|nr:hypothetical protein G9A89_005322 [Geosiphon pyriformis]